MNSTFSSPREGQWIETPKTWAGKISTLRPSLKVGVVVKTIKTMALMDKLRLKKTGKPLRFFKVWGPWSWPPASTYLYTYVIGAGLGFLIQKYSTADIKDLLYQQSENGWNLPTFSDIFPKMGIREQFQQLHLWMLGATLRADFEPPLFLCSFLTHKVFRKRI